MKMMKKENEKNLFKKFFSVVSSIADRNYQKTVWVEAQGPEVGDFDELCIALFSSCDSIMAHASELEISNKQLTLLAQFRNEFDRFADDNNWPPLFIDKPEWMRITEMAEEVLQAFDYKPRLS